MSPEARRLILEHQARLNRLLDDHRDLLAKLEHTEPSLVEREAIATVLHSFYTGVEFILRSVATEFEDGIPPDRGWHAALLGAMQRHTPGRRALLRIQTGERLMEYLVFRHRFRNIYSFELDWTMMRPLVAGLREVNVEFQFDVDRFLRSDSMA